MLMRVLLELSTISADNMFGEQVDLRYKKPNPDEGDPRPSAEFEVEQSQV